MSIYNPVSRQMFIPEHGWNGMVSNVEAGSDPTTEQLNRKVISLIIVKCFMLHLVL